MTKFRRARVTACAFALASVAALAAVPAPGAELTGPAKKMLKDLKLDPAILNGLDAELKVPKAWIDGAKKEGKVTYLGTFNYDSWPKFIALFKARYPFANVEHQRANHFARVAKPLIAFREGRVIANVIAAVGARIKGYKAAGALMDLRVLPNFRRVPENARAKDGTWVGEKLKKWCMSYNKTLIKESDLPKTWDDLITDKALRGGNLGITNRPHNWILPLWTTKGEAWTRDFVHKLFTVVKPQLRKEGALALIKLNTAGEFKAAIPATNYRVADIAAKGAPLGWHCPDPVPETLSEIVAIKGSAAPNTTKLFLNWYLSKEGQIAIYYSTGAEPVREFPDISFDAYPEQSRGKSFAVRSPEDLLTSFAAMSEVWRPAWRGAGGYVPPKASKVKTVLVRVQRGGRIIVFKVGDATHKAKLSRSRTRVTLGGKSVNRKKLKAGLACEVTYAGNGGEAKLVACK